jgi:hypothetical protein
MNCTPAEPGEEGEPGSAAFYLDGAIVKIWIFPQFEMGSHETGRGSTECRVGRIRSMILQINMTHPEIKGGRE